ncbi:MAG: helix-turn-helix transcriptional regulator [Dehalococcoidia bacterium]
MAEKSKVETPEPAPPTASGSGQPFASAFQFPAPPRDLLSAYMLLLLRNWSMHGYQLMQQLSTMFGFQATDPGSIYRHLRQLEKQGFISSNWETGAAGPARRTYTLTEAGDTFLQGWAGAIENYQKTLKFWSDLYTGMIAPKPKE